MSAISGWYPDPAGSPDLRFWDGERWAATTMPRPVPAPQGTAVALAPPPGVAPLPRSPSSSPAPQWAYSRPGIPYAPAPPLPKPRSRTPKLLTALAVFIAVCVVAAVVSKAADNAKTQAAVNNTSIQFPATVGDLNKITGSLGDEFASLAGTETAACSCGANYQVAGYAEPGGLPKAIVVATKFHVGDRLDTAVQKEEDGFARSLSKDGLSPVTFTGVDAGSLGGKMQCGTTAVGSVPVTTCVFADRAVFGAVLVYDRDGSGSQDLTLVHELRSAVEVRG